MVELPNAAAMVEGGNLICYAIFAFYACIFAPAGQLRRYIQAIAPYPLQQGPLRSHNCAPLWQNFHHGARKSRHHLHYLLPKR
jgi:hypothetical protein